MNKSMIKDDEINKEKAQKLEKNLNNIFDILWKEYQKLEDSINELTDMYYKNRIFEEYQGRYKIIISNLCQIAVHQLDELQELGGILYEGSLYNIFFELCHVKKGALLQTYHNMIDRNNIK